jgi:hypothetical protein
MKLEKLVGDRFRKNRQTVSSTAMRLWCAAAI